MLLLLARKARTLYNTLAALRGWPLVKNLLFAGVGLLMLAALYAGFWRVLHYLETVQLIGPMLSWKLTAMVLLMTFAMVIVSSIIISMSTLYYSFDLKFLVSCPLDLRAVFMDKAFETVFYSSWTLVLAILPFVVALGRVKGMDAGFYLSYLLLMVPFVMLAGAFGIFFSMTVMYCFPSSKTRDITWLLGSLSVAFVYIAFRFSQPERLLRPDSLQVVAQYVQFLQSPTAPYLPSWWVTRAMIAYSAGHWGTFAASAGALFLTAAGLYTGLYFLAGRLYMRGFSGAQGTARFSGGRAELTEQRLAARYPAWSVPLTLFWKDRLTLLRDARYWSQIILIAALIAVYLFSIRQLPLDTPALKSLISFFNVAIAGFVMAAIGLRFTFPAVSLEGNNYWLLKSAPVTTAAMLREKLMISLPPAVAIGVLLITASNYLLGADQFVSVLSTVTIAVAAVVITVMGIGFGAVFPDFKVENIHQLESSYGGFLYMATAMGYLALLLGTEAWPVQMHFVGMFGHNAWDMRAVAVCAAGFLLLNAAALYLPWKIGLKNLEKYEI